MNGGLFDGSGPRWFTIPASRPFVVDLAKGLHDALAAEGPESLADALLLTPGRRGARALADAFVTAAGGRPVLLPQIRAVGDLDEGEPPFEPGDLVLDLPPAVSPLRRRFELARLVAEHGPALGRALDAASALEMADALAAVFDSLAIEGVTDPEEKIEALVEGEQARHWRISADFLSLAVRRWPARLDELGLIDPTVRRVRLLEALADQWSDQPPTRPLIAAGSTGTAPSTARLLGVVAEAPRGCVVLPGLDLELAEDAWDEVDEQHPQGAMKRLLARHGVGRGAVRPWPASRGDGPQAAARRRIVNEALRPAEATKDWRRQIDRLRAEGAAAGIDPMVEGLSGLSVATARGEDEAATVVALLLREALETPDKTAALVTPDQTLARRVAAKLARWGVEADSSAGAPLAGFPIGVLLDALLRLVEDPLDPIALLAALKHPLTRLGRTPEALKPLARGLERRGLRGPRPRDWDELAARVADAPELTPLVEELRALVEVLAAPFADGPVAIPAATRALARAVETLAPDAWAGAAGEAASVLLAQVIDEGEAPPPVTASAFAALLRRLLADETVRTGGALHPRLRILGAIEARLVRADRLVLAGLEEGVWPRPAPTDPFLSRPMRARLGLPAPERRIGLSAHDFAQAACAPEVILVHAERRGGQPAAPSRWLWRLETLARGAGLSLPRRDDVLAWARAIDRVEAPPPSLRTARRPEPRPPVEARPRQLSVTTVEKWVRDPYSVYARHVLKLKQIDRPDERVEARARGTAIHAAIERLAQEWPSLAPADAPERFATVYLEELRKAGAPATALIREGVLARRAGVWLAELEQRRRATGADVRVELPTEYGFDTAGGRFTLTVKADRLEIEDGRAHVIDFKTGRVPTAKEIRSDFSPQLTLTAALLARGAFGELGAPEPGDLTYVRVTGRATPGEEIVRVPAGESAAAAETAWAGLLHLIERYERAETPYASRTAPRFAAAPGGDYDHLARVREWSIAGEDEAEGGE